MEKGYCPKCAKEVYMKREDIDICLCIILAIFTAGIGLLIYMVIYLDKKENRCVHCNSICHPILKERSEIRHQDVSQPVSREIKHTEHSYTNSSTLQSKETKNDINKYKDRKFCHSCGSHIQDPTNSNYCILCGAELD